MPLAKGYSSRSIGKNIKSEQRAGKTRKQALAIALRSAREAAAKSDSVGARKARRRLMLRDMARGRR